MRPAAGKLAAILASALPGRLASSLPGLATERVPGCPGSTRQDVSVAARLARRWSAWRKDALCATLLAAGMVTLSLWCSAGLGDVLLRYTTWNLWFDADVPRVLDNMCDRWSNQWRRDVHPLFTLLTYPWVWALKQLPGVSPLLAVRVLLAGVSALWLGTIFAALRCCGCRRMDALLVGGLALSSSASVFWCGVPETHLFGGLTVSLAMLLGVATIRGLRSTVLGFALITALTCAATVSNVSAGLISGWAALGRRRAWRSCLCAGLIVAGLVVIQDRVFPIVKRPDGHDESSYVLHEASESRWAVLRAFGVHAMVMPEMTLVTHNWPRLSVQSAGVGSSGALGIAATLLWCGLLLVGVYRAIVNPRLHRAGLLVGAILGAQLCVVLLYGTETILLAPNWIAALVVLAGLALADNSSSSARAMTAVLVVVLMIHNIGQFQAASRFIHREYDAVGVLNQSTGETKQNAVDVRDIEGLRSALSQRPVS